METIRTFVAIELKVEQTLKESWQHLRNLLQGENIKWVDEQTLHLTLFFLGETQIKAVNEISNNLEINIIKVPAFTIKLQGFGSFGNPGNPKVIWVGITKSESIIHLQRNVSEVLISFGFKAESRDFSPHITLGRVKHMKSSASLVEFIQNNRLTFFQESLVERVILYRSDLKPTGPIYTPIKTFKLLCP